VLNRARFRKKKENRFSATSVRNRIRI